MTLRIEEVAVAAAVCFLSAAWYLRGQIAAKRSRCLFPDSAKCFCIEVSQPARTRSSPKSAIVIGAGIVGVCVAKELARRGVRVTVIERESSPGTVATAASWAWVNANGKTPHVYQKLNMLAMKAWECVLPGAVRWCGSLVISEGAEQADKSYAVREVSLQEVSELEPCLDVGSEARRALGWDEEKKIFSFEQEGLVEATQAVIKLVTEAEALGVQFIYNQEVHGFPWEIEGDVAGVVYGTGREELFADCVVLCNGVGVQGLAAKAGYTLRMDHK